ncbi:MAG: extracellular matrix regulator RemB [Oscillospiraceae bacterium]
MYLYLGQDTVIQTDSIVGIFDLDNTTTSRITKSYLAEAQKNGQVVAVSQELPKSFVVCEEKERTTVYLSQISPSTLRKRSGLAKEMQL